MTTLVNLSFATKFDGPLPAAANVTFICDTPAPGVIRRVSLSPAGITIQRGTDGGEPLRVLIPLQELLQLAEEAEPAMGSTKPAPEQPAAFTDFGDAEDRDGKYPEKE